MRRARSILCRALLVCLSGARAAAQVTPGPTPVPVPAPPTKSLLAVKLQSLFDDGDDKGAKELAESRLPSAPQDTEARLIYARTLVRLGAKAPVASLAAEYYTKALEQVLTARSQHPERLDIQLYVLDVYYHARRPELLLTDAAALLASRPGQPEVPEALAFYGEQYLATDRAKSAADVYALLARAEPGRLDWTANEGTALLVAGDLDGGLAALRRAVRIAPGDADTVHNLAQACVYKGDWTGALNGFRSAVALRPSMGRFILDLAVVHALSAPAEAEPEFYKARDLLGGVQPQSVLVERLAGGMLDPEPTIEEAERLAQELKDAGYPIYAVVAAEKALRLDPERILPRHLRADILDGMRYHAAALPDYATLREQLDKLPEPQRGNAWEAAVSGEARSLAAVDRGAEALALLRGHGGEPRFPFETAAALAANGDMDGARKILEKIAQKTSDPQRSAAARDRLRDLLEGAP